MGVVSLWSFGKYSSLAASALLHATCFDTREREPVVCSRRVVSCHVDRRVRPRLSHPVRLEQRSGPSILFPPAPLVTLFAPELTLIAPVLSLPLQSSSFIANREAHGFTRGPRSGAAAHSPLGSHHAGLRPPALAAAVTERRGPVSPTARRSVHVTPPVTAAPDSPARRQWGRRRWGGRQRWGRGRRWGGGSEWHWECGARFRAG